MDFKQQFESYKTRIDNRLKTYFQDECEECKTLIDSVKYSLLAGGKRIRPVLMYAVSDMIGCAEDRTVDVFAAALEMIHSSSLIHDDLPGMDNDSLRRGLPTNHVVYGEGTAIIAGDTLMFKAFEIAADHVYNKSFKKGSVKALWMLGEAAGHKGMTGGQMIDMESIPDKTDLNRLILMNSKKTGALIDFAVKAPIYITETEHIHEKPWTYIPKYQASFSDQGRYIDYESSEEELGKSTSDERNRKATYVTVLGLNTAKEHLYACYDTACSALKPYGEKASFLLALAAYVKDRGK